MPPVIAAIGSITAFIGSLGVIGTIALNLGASVVLGAVSRRLQRRAMRRMEAGLNADRRFTVRAPIQPRNMVYGRVRTGGTIVYLHEDEPYLHIVIVLATHSVKGIGAIYFNGEEAIDASGAGVGRWADQADRVLVEKRLGHPWQPAFNVLQGVPGSGWTAEHRLAGCASIALRLRASREAFPSGIPDIQVDIEGKDDILDPRTGARGYTANAALCVADYMAEPTFGLGVAIGEADGIDPGDLIVAANVCDEAVPLAAGGTEPRYTCNGVVYLNDTPQQIIEGMLTAMQGSAVFTGGRWRILAGAYRVPTVTLTADDAVDGGIRVTPKIPLRDNFNAVRGTFISPENDWQPDDFPPIRSATYRAEDDGAERWADLSLPFTISASTAQRLARIELERQRRQMTVRFSGKLTCLRVAAGDTVLLTYARYGLDAKPFVVAAMSTRADPDQGAVVDLTLRETSPLVYAWDATEEEIYAAAPRPALPSPFAVPAPGVPALSEFLFPTREGTGVRAAIRVQWQPSTSAVSDYEVEARRFADNLGVPTGDPWVTRGRTAETLVDILDVRPGLWQVRVRAFSTLGVASPFAQSEQEIFGLSQPPQALQGVTLQAAGGLAVIKWRQAADLDVRLGGSIVIRHSTNTPAAWANSVAMDEVAGAQAIAVVPLKPGAYLVRARDSSGNYGPIAELFSGGAQVVPFAPITSLQADPAFGGAKTNLFETGGVLTLDVGDLWDATPGNWDARSGMFDQAGLAQSPGLYEFATGMDLGSLRSVRLRSEIRFVSENVFDLWDDRATSWDAAEGTFDGGDNGACDVVIEVRTTPDNPAGSPVWSGWSRLDSTETTARAVQARAHVTTTDGTFRPLVDRLRVFADEVA